MAVAGDRPTRRAFLQAAPFGSLALLAACGRLPGQPPPAPSIPRVGHLGGNAETTTRGALLWGFREHGYVGGQNLVVEARAYAAPDELPRLAAELVRLPVDVLIAPTT